MKMKAIALLCLLSFSMHAQTLDKLIKSGEILVTGLTILKDKHGVGANGIIDKICVRNKLTDKITFNFAGTDSDGIVLSKSLVIQKDGKECLLEIPSGVYTYEIVLSNKEIYKRGEYRFDESMTITVKPN
jgi:hypothetical protein